MNIEEIKNFASRLKEDSAKWSENFSNFKEKYPEDIPFPVDQLEHAETILKYHYNVDIKDYKIKQEPQYFGFKYIVFYKK